MILALSQHGKKYKKQENSVRWIVKNMIVAPYSASGFSPLKKFDANSINTTVYSLAFLSVHDR